MMITSIILSIIGVVFTIVGVIRLKKERDRLNDELIFILADRDSYRNMYGPNPITRLPEIEGTRSETVLIDISGQNDSAQMFLGCYSSDLELWCFDADSNGWTRDEMNDFIANGSKPVWYRLPLKKYEDKRLSR